MFDLQEVELVDSVVLREMNFPNGRETLIRDIVDQKKALLGPADICLAVGAPSGWVRGEADAFSLLYLDQPDEPRTLDDNEYQILPPGRLQHREFLDWTAKIVRYVNLSLTAPSLLCLDFSDLLRVLDASPSKRLIADILPADGCKFSGSLEWLKGCSGLLSVAFDGGQLCYEEILTSLEYFGTLLAPEAPHVSSIKIQPRQPEVIFVLAGVAHM